MSASFAILLFFAVLALFFVSIKLYAMSIRPAGSIQDFVVGSHEDLDGVIDRYCQCEECSLCGSICDRRRG